MKRALLKPTALILFTGLVVAAGQAMAGCGMGTSSAAAKSMVYRSDGSGGGLLKTDYFPEDHLLQASAFGPFRTAAITGLWKFTFTSDGTHPGPPQGAPVDAGFVTWHDDGTEIMNSGRTPASGSFCMGVWRQVGARTYKLTHWAISWIPMYVPGQTNSWSEVGGPDSAFQPAGPTSIQETIALSRDGNEYTGTFTLTSYVYDGKSVTDANTSAGQPMVITGSVAATRIEP